VDAYRHSEQLFELNFQPCKIDVSQHACTIDKNIKIAVIRILASRG
jgi:hypothetical protein